MHLKFQAFVIFLFSLSSCVKDKPVPAKQQQVQLSSFKKVYVVNEGNFGTANSSVSLYDPGTGQVVENIYQQANNVPLGDVAQDLQLINGKFYIVVNNSGRLVACDTKFNKTGQLNGLASPRYILRVSNQKAYVSDLKANGIHIIDLNSLSKTGTISCPGWTEKMAAIYNKVFVTNVKRNYVYVVNALTDVTADSIFVGPAASGLVIDKHDKLWVLSGGDSTKSIAPRLSRINTMTNATEAAWEYGPGLKPGYLCCNGGRDSLYFLSGGIYLMRIEDAVLPSAPLIPAAGHNFYGVGINPSDYHLYASDALDYSQKSNIYIYDVKGGELGFFKAGINASGFYFE